MDKIEKISKRSLDSYRETSGFRWDDELQVKPTEDNIGALVDKINEIAQRVNDLAEDIGQLEGEDEEQTLDW